MGGMLRLRAAFRPGGAARSPAMTCPDCGGTSTIEVVSILLAAGAFVVSVASFWFASLRRPSVSVDRIAAPNELQSGGWKDGMVAMPVLHLRFFLANSGASGTVVERFEVADFEEANDGPAIWSGMELVPWDAMCSSAWSSQRPWSATTRPRARRSARSFGTAIPR